MFIAFNYEMSCSLAELDMIGGALIVCLSSRFPQLCMWFVLMSMSQNKSQTAVLKIQDGDITLTSSVAKS